MKITASRFILFALLCAAACPLLAGCGHQGNESTISKQEESQFKGGPMPPEARKAMQEADQKRAAATAAPPPAATGKP